MRDGVRQRLDDTILSLYRQIRYPVFPVDPVASIHRMPRCKYITYDDLARVSGVDYRTVVKACESLDGCTQYDPVNERYLVAINTSAMYGASKARIRWTTAHELGHISAGHFIELAQNMPDIQQPSAFREMEEEADYFAAAFLAPIPALKALRVRRPANIRDWFGLSQTAAEYRWSDLQRQQYDERLDDLFWIFRPSSDVKEFRRAHPKGIDIRMDAVEKWL